MRPSQLEGVKKWQLSSSFTLDSFTLLLAIHIFSLELPIILAIYPMFGMHDILLLVHLFLFIFTFKIK